MGKQQSSHGELSSLSQGACSDGGTSGRTCKLEMTQEEAIGKAMEEVSGMQQAGRSFQGRKKRSYGGGAAACEAEGGCTNTWSVGGYGRLQGGGNSFGGGGIGGGCPRDRLQRHRLQVAGSARIPDAWCGEARLREWVSSCEVEDALQPPGLFSARAALISAGSSPAATRTVVVPAPCEVSLRS
ncbi:hypothetical protein GOP47_0018220 [Adiantum capillus-veneris]|uniref:Uncharacterized protein n=1 Tax=Adiantum capillus-veneris TaxID=13818 RepID=A0A9D4UHC4_ADICA|nr:hypothetical protein GOP47_0018220 [Adiantum capillus-veneris]